MQVDAIADDSKADVRADSKPQWKIESSFKFLIEDRERVPNAALSQQGRRAAVAPSQ